MHWKICLIDKKRTYDGLDKAFVRKLFTLLFDRGVTVDIESDPPPFERSIDSSTIRYTLANKRIVIANILYDLFGRRQATIRSLRAVLRFPGIGFPFILQARLNSEKYCYLTIDNNVGAIIHESALTEFLNICSEIFTLCNFTYGELCSEDSGLYFDENGLPKSKLNIANFFSGELVDKIGRSKLLSVPAERIQEINDGGIFIFLAKEWPGFRGRFRQVLGLIRENVNFVGQSSDAYVWQFLIAGNARKISEATDEMLVILRRMFEVIDGFFIPTKVEYKLQTYAKDAPAKRLFNEPGENPPIDHVFKTIENNSGLTYNDLVDGYGSIEFRNNLFNHIFAIEISGKTSFILNGKDLFIDEHSPEDQYAYCYGEWITNDTVRPPLCIEVECELFVDSKDVDSPLIYSITFWTNTDIWFDQTEIGRANMYRLQKIFKKLRENYDVTSEDHYQV